MRDLFSTYPIESWILKLEWYKQIMENYNEEFLLNLNSRIEAIERREIKFQNMINLEIHVMLFQSIEALFNLLFALEDPSLEYAWLNLSFPKSFSKRSMASYDKISNLKKTTNLHNYLRKKIKISPDVEKELWEYLFFYNYDIEEAIKNTVFRNIKRILSKLLEFFSDRDDYNSYKHGLRLSCSNNASIHIASESSSGVRNGPWIPSGFSRYVLIFHYKKKNRDGITRIYERTKSYSLKEDLFYIECCISLLENVINMRNDSISNFHPYKFQDFSFFQQQDYTLISNSWSVLSDIDILRECVIAYQENNFEKSQYFALKVLQIAPRNNEAIKILGLTYYNLKIYEQAKKYFILYRKYNHRHLDFEITLYLAYIQLNLRNLNESQKLIDEIIENKNQVEKETLNKSYEVKARIYLAKNQKKYEICQKNNSKWLKKAKKNLIKSDPEKNKLIDLWYKLGEIYVFLGRSEGQEILNSLIEQNSNNSQLMFKVGNLYIKGFDRKKAGEIYQKIVDKFPDNPDGWNNLGMYLFEEKIDIKKAKEYVNKAFDKKKELFYLKNIFKIIKKDRNSSWDEIDEKILSLNDFKLIFGLSGLYFEEKEYDKSLYFLKKAEGLKPNEFSVQWHKGIVLLHKKCANEALKCFLKGSESDLREKSTIYNTACCYAQKKDIPNVILWLNKLIGEHDDMLEKIKDDSDFDEIRHNIEFLNFIGSLN